MNESQKLLRAMRRMSNITQSQLAAEIDRSQPLISSYETGCKSLSPERLAELLAAIERLAKDGEKLERIRNENS